MSYSKLTLSYSNLGVVRLKLKFKVCCADRYISADNDLIKRQMMIYLLAEDRLTGGKTTANRLSHTAM